MNRSYIKIKFKNGHIIEIDNYDNMSVQEIFSRVFKSELVKLYNYIFNLNDVLYIKIFNIRKLSNVFKN